jgi:hypothetical protein
VDGADRHDQPRAFDAREGGSFRISLTYNAPTASSPFVKLLTNEQVVEVVEFETTDPALRGDDDHDRARRITRRHRDPRRAGRLRGLSTADNEAGWRSSLGKLAALVETG